MNKSMYFRKKGPLSGVFFSLQIGVISLHMGQCNSSETVIFVFKTGVVARITIQSDEHMTNV
jgi:hypothetical protein